MRFSLILLSLLFFSSLALAHPGRTNSEGCHKCKTNCEKWGQIKGATHCH